MKRMFILAALAFATAGVSAQSLDIAREGVYYENGQLVFAAPSTVIAVDLQMRCERVATGPYARYAQKFLGARAPLTDKTSYSIAGASIAVLPAAESVAVAGSLAEPKSETVSHNGSADEFARVLPDAMSAAPSTLEKQASAAAEAIFSIRRHRMDLITGEAGEYVFGEGLRAALEELAAREQAYLELFFGKQTVKEYTVRCIVRPSAAERNYIVARFNPVQGLVPVVDMSGDAVLLQIEPSGVMPDYGLVPAPEKAKNTIGVRLADYSNCTLSTSEGIVAEASLPIFEFGRTVQILRP